MVTVVTFHENKNGGVIGRLSSRKIVFIDDKSMQDVYPDETWLVEVSHEEPTFCFAMPIRKMIAWIWTENQISFMLIDGHPYLIKDPENSGDWVTIVNRYQGEVFCASPIETSVCSIKKETFNEFLYWKILIDHIRKETKSDFYEEEFKKTVRRNFPHVSDRLDANEKIWELRMQLS